MNPDVGDFIHTLRAQVRHAPALRRMGRVTAVTGLVIESEGPNVGLGELCLLSSERDDFEVMAEVVGFRGERVLLMPLGETGGLHAGCPVTACDRPPLPVAGPALLGRVLDALGRPFDSQGPVPMQRVANGSVRPPHPLRRRRIHETFPTGVRALDVFTPFGRGQRLGLFAGSGVGKSTLLGMIARSSQADVVVIALVGERGREVREFLEKDLGEAGLARSVVVVATSDTPAPLRLRAATTATAIAEGYRDQGKNVLLLMDSVTRFAMAQREIGLAIGEPPATRGYTPSVFALLPRLLERAGSGETGAITALYTVLVEGDDMNEPVADTVRGILDGHLVLSRALAHANHYPAIDVLESVSRLTRDICQPAEVELAARAREHLALYKRNEDLITVGAYQKGASAALDRAVALNDGIKAFLRQSVDEVTPRTDAYRRLNELLGTP
jgi:flagellum-specific ATP synthase